MAAYSSLTAFIQHAGVTLCLAAQTVILLNHVWFKSWNSQNVTRLPTCWIRGKTGWCTASWNNFGIIQTVEQRLKARCWKVVITKLYQSVHQRVTVDDPELSRLGIPILKINTKCVAEFIRRQEASSAISVTDQGLAVLRRHQSITSTSQPPAAELPAQRPHSSQPQVHFEFTPSLAGTRKVKPRLSHVSAASHLQPSPALVHTLPAAPAPLTSSQPTTPLQTAASLPQPLFTSARSTLYKRKKGEQSGAEQPSKVRLYTCTLCGRPTQGHKKYRKKTYCELSKSTTFKGLAGRVFDTFVEFKNAVEFLGVWDRTVCLSTCH